MGFTAHPGATYNVIGSFNDFFERQLTAKGLPAFLASAVVNYDYPEQPLTFPTFSITHLPSQPREVAQGRQLDPGFRGAEQVALADIRAWVSRQAASGQHAGQLRILRDMAARVFATGAAISVLDVYGSTANPTGNGTIVRASPAREAPLTPDPNPDVAAARLLVEYRWLERVPTV